MSRAEAEFLDVSPIFDYALSKKKGSFESDLCEVCGERVFAHKLHDVNGKRVCIPCSEGKTPDRQTAAKD